MQGDTLNAEIKSLEGVPFARLYDAWCEAFSDYAVGMQIGSEQLATSFRQNAVDLAASAGAFEDGRLVGFWLNGVRERKGRRWAYDAGTAVVPSCRGKGLSTELAACSNRLLEARAIDEYVLEVLTTNDRAFQIYRKDGFRVTRRFGCFRRPSRVDRGTALPADEVVEAAPFRSSSTTDLLDPEYEPSWQNSLEAATAAAASFTVVHGRRSGKLVGSGLIQPKRGRIARLAFAPDAWDTPLAAAVVERLLGCADTESVDIVCVEEGGTRTVGLLQSTQFALFAEQWEMHKTLR